METFGYGSHAIFISRIIYRSFNYIVLSVTVGVSVYLSRADLAWLPYPGATLFIIGYNKFLKKIIEKLLTSIILSTSQNI